MTHVRRGVAVVTGASSGIGEATARRLTVEGWHVVAAARRVDLLERLADEIGCTPVEMDVTSDDSVARLRQVVEAMGADLTLLVNNAGGAVGRDPVASSAVADWQRMYDVNVLGTLRVTSALLPALQAAPSALVVVLTSTAASGVYEGGGGYVAAKHAQGALSRTLRLELAGTRVRVSEIAPGMVATEEFTLNRLGGDAEAAARVYADVDRPLTAGDVADCIAWTATRPAHVDVDLLVVRPLAQTTRSVHRGPIF